MSVLLLIFAILGMISMLAGIASLFFDLRPMPMTPRRQRLISVALIGIGILAGSLQFAVEGNPLATQNRKLQQARSLIAHEILTGMARLDERLTFVNNALVTDTASARIADMHATIAPARALEAADGTRQLVKRQQATALRQAFNSRPLAGGSDPALMAVLMESGARTSNVQTFYDQLLIVNDSSEDLLYWLETQASAAARSADNQALGDRVIATAQRALTIDSHITYLYGLMALADLETDSTTINARLSALTQLTPRQQTSRTHVQQQLERLLSERAQVVADKYDLLRTEQRLLMQTETYSAAIKRELTINPTDRWNDVVGKAITLRQLGLIPESVAAFSRYRDMFGATDPTAEQYAATAQAFTLQAAVLNVVGGLYLVEIQPQGAAARAGLQAGDILIAFNDHVVASLPEFIAAQQAAPSTGPIALTYLRLGADGRFERHTATLRGSVLGAQLMPI